MYKRKAGIAQLVEQWTENPRVTSSNLVPGIFTGLAVRHSSDVVQVLFANLNNLITALTVLTFHQEVQLLYPHQ